VNTQHHAEVAWLDVGIVMRIEGAADRGQRT